ncbi:MAG TPA: extracellular solute-binding protein [Firmicutes bacterium]|nr:extracellular solute-binding protein [Bacillota bacterium]
MKLFSFCCALLVLACAVSGCSYADFVAQKTDSLTLWHNFGGQLKETMDSLVDEFNETVGLQEGIFLTVTSVSGSASIHEKLVMAAKGDPGAPALPDISTVYPKTASILAAHDLLVDLNTIFSEKELAAYLPSFLREGMIDGRLFVFPTAKSTEVLFVNSTIFNRFAGETGISLDLLRTFEGIREAGALYYEWTDKQTPHLEDDGKMFFMPDSLFNLTLTCFEQFGSSFVTGTTLDLESQLFARVWDFYLPAAASGQMAIYDGYATDLAKTGDIVCSIGSTAGVSFFSPTVTYTDNTSEPAELVILPYPVFASGKKTAIQRGSGMCVFKSTPEQEKKAGVFLAWFTRPENNLRFITTTGYIPVTEEAYNQLLQNGVPEKDENIRKLRGTVRQMQAEYSFYLPPVAEETDALQQQYESRLKAAAAEARSAYLGELNNTGTSDILHTLSAAARDNFIRDFKSNKFGVK